MSKDSILSLIRKNRPAPVELPEIPNFHQPESNLKSIFCEVAQKSGTQVVFAKNIQMVNELLPSVFPNLKTTATTITGLDSNFNLSEISSAIELDGLDLAILESTLGVAENGAIWISEVENPIRVLPFITQHLAIVLSERDIVDKMHAAYQKIQINATGFGVFIGGPSKTADIEQALVVGAQGARSLTIFLLEDKS